MMLAARRSLIDNESHHKQRAGSFHDRPRYPPWVFSVRSRSTAIFVGYKISVPFLTTVFVY